MDSRLKRAIEEIMPLIQANPELSISLEGQYEPVFQGGTNRVLLGQYKGTPIVLKCFCNRERKAHEKAALQLFEPTGLVPKLFPIETETVLVMQRLKGLPMFMAERDLTQTQIERLYHQLGKALARVAEVGPGGDTSGQPDMKSGAGYDYHFYCEADLPIFFDTVIERSTNVLAHEDIPERETLDKSLSALKQGRGAILSYPSFLHMDDFHTSNIMADGSEVQGFIDLEMSRRGNEILQLGAALAIMIHGRTERWSWIRRGYEDGRGRSLDRNMISLAAIVAPFSQWVRFMWGWTGDQRFQEKGERWSPIRDIKAAVKTVESMHL